VEYRKSIEFRCSPARLWPYLIETEKMKVWMKELVDIKPTNQRPMGTGATYEMIVKEGGKEVAYLQEVFRFVDGREIAMRFSGGSFPKGLHIDIVYKLTNEGGSTRFDYECAADLEGWQRLLSPVLFFFNVLQMRTMFKRLRKVLEEGV
jgi:hypothetical protein